jgi:galactokinase
MDDDLQLRIDRIARRAAEVRSENVQLRLEARHLLSAGQDQLRELGRLLNSTQETLDRNYALRKSRAHTR